MFKSQKNLASLCFLLFTIAIGTVGILKSTETKAITSPYTGKCVMLANVTEPFLILGPNQTDRNVDVLAIIDFDQGTFTANITSAITDGNYAANTTTPSNSLTFQSAPTSAITFSVENGPLSGSYRLRLSPTNAFNIYSVNSGNTFLVQGHNGKFTGVCQRA